MPTKPKSRGKRTWAKLAADPSISKAELPRIARAFGLKKPEDVPSVSKRSRTEGTSKTKATKKKATTKAKATPRTKPATSVAWRTEPGKKPSHRGKKYEGTQDAGPEGVYKSRIRVRKSPGGKAGRAGTTITKAKPTKARKLTDARGRPIRGLQGPKPGSRNIKRKR